MSPTILGMDIKTQKSISGKVEIYEKGKLYRDYVSF